MATPLHLQVLYHRSLKHAMSASMLVDIVKCVATFFSYPTNCFQCLMDRLSPRQRPIFSGFTKAEIEKMEKLFMESRELLQSKESCQKLARNFSSSSGCASKPIVKWNKFRNSPIIPSPICVSQVQNWFTTRQQESEVKVPSVANTYKDESGLPQTCLLNDGGLSCQILKGLVSKVGEKVSDLSELEFEAKSSTHRAWYDVDMFLSHRVTSSGETEVHVRFVGFGAEEDEWVNVKKASELELGVIETGFCSYLVY
ncbi:hypothetical protein GOBAR_DD07484 [Gossypium barbadense]|nr:hypothetical protein GOBAR_DD07484 [Gossypium barbadense]